MSLRTAIKKILRKEEHEVKKYNKFDEKVYLSKYIILEEPVTFYTIYNKVKFCILTYMNNRITSFYNTTEILENVK